MPRAVSCCQRPVQVAQSWPPSVLQDVVGRQLAGEEAERPGEAVVATVGEDEVGGGRIVAGETADEGPQAAPQLVALRPIAGNGVGGAGPGGEAPCRLHLVEHGTLAEER